jgi:hypothetical protein
VIEYKKYSRGISCDNVCVLEDGRPIGADEIVKLLNSKTRTIKFLMDIKLGDGNKLVTSIHNYDEKWAGFCVSDSNFNNLNIGEITETEAKTDNDLNAFMRIRTANPASLNVIIDICQQAKQKLFDMNKKLK